MMKVSEAPASFKDPSGFVFLHKNRLLRQINYFYQDNYDLLMKSGLYQKLVADGMLIPHQEIDFPQKQTQAYKFIEPQPIPFISYPWEWCFGQLKDAGLLTLQIQKISLEHGMSLKDASSFNIQFLQGRPIFIDTLSFEKYEEGKPWVAYQQFCRQFLAPLAVSAFTDIRLAKLLQVYLDGIPLDLAAKLLPFTAKLKPSLFLHIFLHAQSQKKFAASSLPKKLNQSFSRRSFLQLVENLEESSKKLNWKLEPTVWTAYHKESIHASYNDRSLKKKKELVEKYLTILKPKTVWDVGANTGEFSRIAAQKGIFTISLDSDHSCVEQNYQLVKKNKEKNILPLLVDLVNPTPAIGWENRERQSFLSRSSPDTILALALIHHLAIGNNLPLAKLARFFANHTRTLIIEFVPRQDKMTQLLLQNRQDIFPDYKQSMFEKEFSHFFIIKERAKLPDSDRILYLMVGKKTK